VRLGRLYLINVTQFRSLLSDNPTGMNPHSYLLTWSYIWPDLVHIAVSLFCYALLPWQRFLSWYIHFLHTLRSSTTCILEKNFQWWKTVTEGDPNKTHHFFFFFLMVNPDFYERQFFLVAYFNLSNLLFQWLALNTFFSYFHLSVCVEHTYFLNVFIEQCS